MIKKEILLQIDPCFDEVGAIFFQEKPFTVCVKESVSKPGRLVVGVTKWNPNDKKDPQNKWDPKKGFELAFVRATLADTKALADSLVGSRSESEANLLPIAEEVDEWIGDRFGVHTVGMKAVHYSEEDLSVLAQMANVTAKVLDENRMLKKKLQSIQSHLDELLGDVVQKALHNVDLGQKEGTA